MNISKKKTLLKHSKRRLFERYGLSFNNQQLKDMAFICKNGHYLCHFGRQSLTKSKMLIKFNQIVFPVIYDKQRHCIITVLTMNMLSDEEKKLAETFLTTELD